MAAQAASGAFGDEAELQRLLAMFTSSTQAAGSEQGTVLGYQVTPVNVATGQALAKPQTLTGTAAMAAHVMLMKIHSKQLVSGGPRGAVGRHTPVARNSSQCVRRREQQRAVDQAAAAARGAGELNCSPLAVLRALHGCGKIRQLHHAPNRMHTVRR
jgi:hypothetical protein